MFWRHRWMYRPWRHHPWHRPFWGPRPMFWGAGCGCLPLVLLAALMLFGCLATMCSAPYNGYYGWY